MPSLLLEKAERKALSAHAHALNPVVLLGAAGLTPAVLQEIDRALTAHELIKVRLTGMDREARQTASEQISHDTCSATVQLIGSMLVLYRPRPEDEASR
ncbi:MAG: YhbY family RNA-binding protein [Lautropia sp.]|nr:YhbY family RNA-binding protein [Lautropia sp.]